MLQLIVTLAILSPALLGVLIHMRARSQRQYDEDRVTYELTFPKDLRQKQVEAYVRSIGSNLRDNRVAGDPSIVFEVQSSHRGIQHLLRVPSRDSEYLMGQLEGHIIGTDITPAEKVTDIGYDYGEELSMTNPALPIPISNVDDYSTKILKSIATTDRERITLQWIVYHPAPGRKQGGLVGAVLFGAPPLNQEPSPNQKDDKKALDQNYAVVGRIAARAATEARAVQLVQNVRRALQSESSDANRLITKPIRYRYLDDVMNKAVTPARRGIQFTVSELTAFLGWPVGDPQVPGLSQGSARRFAATEAVSRVGRQLGKSNISGRERPIALSYGKPAVYHTFIGGKTGRGKSVQMANNAYDDMRQGFGVIVLDANSSNSPETVYNRVLNYVPPDRVDDVIALNVSEDAAFPVAFNLFDQGSGRAAIDQIVGVFTSLYPTVATGVAVRDLLYHGIWTLLDHGGLTFVDLAPLISPRGKDEIAWSRKIRAAVKEPELKEFWERVQDKNGDVDSRYAEPLHNKLWQLAGRPEVRHIIGQTNSTLNIRDILANNNILLISLAGLPKESAELLGSLITTVLWETAQSMRPKKSNFLYLDEFQVSARVQAGLDDLLARARKHNFGLTLATQYIENISPDLKAGIINNTGTRIIYETSSKEAQIWIPEFGGRKLVTETDFTGIRMHEAIATIATADGTSAPVTMKALKPYPEVDGVAAQVLELSRRKYGRPVHEVRDEIVRRRRTKPIDPGDDKPLGQSPYDED